MYQLDLLFLLNSYFSLTGIRTYISGLYLYGQITLITFMIFSFPIFLHTQLRRLMRQGNVIIIEYALRI